jgi:chaperonin GroES
LKEEYDMKLVPLGDRVVLKQLVAEETTKSGIVLPGQAKEKPQQAEVVAVGPGGMVDGKEVTMQVKVGDKVIYSKYAGTEVKLDDEEFIIVKQNDIVAVVED